MSGSDTASLFVPLNFLFWPKCPLRKPTSMSSSSNNRRSLSQASLREHPQGRHLSVGFASTPGGLERQELAGIEALRKTFDRLPGSSGGQIPQGVRAAFTRLGFKVGEHIDDLFLAVAPPDGWRLAPAPEAAYRILILDPKGRERGLIFYKDVFYDRQAHAELFPRFHVTRRYLDEERHVVRPTVGTRVQMLVEDRSDGQPAFLTMSVALPDSDVGSPDPRYVDYLDATDAAQVACKNWLDRERPKWRHPLAYWEDVLPDAT